MKIKKAIILSAGYGKRLNPMTLSKPKPLLEINKKTLLENTINILEKYGIKCMSIGFLIGEDTPTIWRGPMIMKALEQMFNGVE